MRTTALMLATALCGIGALSPVCAFAADPYQTPEAGVSGDAYAYQRAGGGGSSYSYRGETTVGGAVGAPVDGRVNCQGYCLPPGYVIEDPNAPRYQPPPVRYEEEQGYVGEPVYHDAGARTGGPLYAGEDRYGTRRTYEERGGYSWGYEARSGGERHETGWDDRRHDAGDSDDWGRERCRQRWDAQGRMIEGCGEIRLSDSFFWGGGGVGPAYIDGGGGGGGGGYAEASAGAGAYASARASVGVSIRIGGRGGHGGKPRGGCGCRH